MIVKIREMPKLLQVPLAPCFEKEYGGGDRGVQGIHDTEHRDAYMCGRCLAPGGRKAGGFSANDNGGGACHVLVVVECGILQLGREYAAIALLKPAYGVFSGAYGNRNGEYGAERGTDQVRIPYVCQWVADDDAVGPGRVSGAQHGPQVSGLFDALQHYVQRRPGQNRAVGGVWG